MMIPRLLFLQKIDCASVPDDSYSRKTFKFFSIYSSQIMRSVNLQEAFRGNPRVVVTMLSDHSKQDVLWGHSLGASLGWELHVASVQIHLENMHTASR